jgi:homoserine dehydrogenase
MPDSPSSDPIHVGLLGFGTVGGAVHQLLHESAADVRRLTGRPVRVVRALVRDLDRDRSCGDAPLPQLTSRFEDVLEDDSIRVVAEVMGGVEPARSHVLALLRRGVSVVSANKQLLARHGEELFAAAEQGGAQLRFEASVCAAIPVVKVLRESMIAAGVREVIGIVNGTTNFVLSAMADQGSSYDDALRRAQELGYAEADPTEDVTGADAAAKLAILASIAFHARVGIDDVPHEGIDALESQDVALAGELGYAVKLIARATLSPEGVSAVVSPTLVPFGHPLARLTGSTNAVMLRGDALREVTLQGPGAGGAETATAIIGDLLGVIGTRGTGFLQHDAYFRRLPLLSPADTHGALYLRLVVDDRPGVLAQVAAALGAHGVSIESLVQRPGADGIATLVLLLHPAREGDAIAAVDEIAGLALSRERPRMLRILTA